MGLVNGVVLGGNGLWGWFTWFVVMGVLMGLVFGVGSWGWCMALVNEVGVWVRFLGLVYGVGSLVCFRSSAY